MNSQTANRASGAAIGFIMVSVIFAAIVVGTKLTLPVPTLDAARAAERTKALAEIRGAENIALNSAGWIDQQRGLVRLPIETAMQMAARKGQVPDAARADRVQRDQLRAAAATPRRASAPRGPCRAVDRARGHITALRPCPPRRAGLARARPHGPAPRLVASARLQGRRLWCRTRPVRRLPG